MLLFRIKCYIYFIKFAIGSSGLILFFMNSSSSSSVGSCTSYLLLYFLFRSSISLSLSPSSFEDFKSSSIAFLDRSALSFSVSFLGFKDFFFFGLSASSSDDSDDDDDDEEEDFEAAPTTFFCFSNPELELREVPEDSESDDSESDDSESEDDDELLEDVSFFAFGAGIVTVDVAVELLNVSKLAGDPIFSWGCLLPMQ